MFRAVCLVPLRESEVVCAADSRSVVVRNGSKLYWTNSAFVRVVSCLPLTLEAVVAISHDEVSLVIVAGNILHRVEFDGSCTSLTLPRSNMVDQSLLAVHDKRLETLVLFPDCVVRVCWVTQSFDIENVPQSCVPHIVLSNFSVVYVPNPNNRATVMCGDAVCIQREGGVDVFSMSPHFDEENASIGRLVALTEARRVETVHKVIPSFATQEKLLLLSDSGVVLTEDGEVVMTSCRLLCNSTPIIIKTDADVQQLFIVGSHCTDLFLAPATDFVARQPSAKDALEFLCQQDEIGVDARSVAETMNRILEKNALDVVMAYCDRQEAAWCPETTLRDFISMEPLQRSVWLLSGGISQWESSVDAAVAHQALQQLCEERSVVLLSILSTHHWSPERLPVGDIESYMYSIPELSDENWKHLVSSELNGNLSKANADPALLNHLALSRTMYKLHNLRLRPSAFRCVTSLDVHVLISDLRSSLSATFELSESAAEDLQESVGHDTWISVRSTLRRCNVKPQRSFETKQSNFAPKIAQRTLSALFVDTSVHNQLLSEEQLERCNVVSEYNCFLTTSAETSALSLQALALARQICTDEESEWVVLCTFAAVSPEEISARSDCLTEEALAFAIFQKLQAEGQTVAAREQALVDLWQVCVRSHSDITRKEERERMSIQQLFDQCHSRLFEFLESEVALRKQIEASFDVGTQLTKTSFSEVIERQTISIDWASFLKEKLRDEMPLVHCQAHYETVIHNTATAEIEARRYLVALAHVLEEQMTQRHLICLQCAAASREMKAILGLVLAEAGARADLLDFAAEEFETIFTLYNDDVGSAQREEAVNTLWETSLQKRGEITRREERERGMLSTVFVSQTHDLRNLLDLEVTCRTTTESLHERETSLLHDVLDIIRAMEVFSDSSKAIEWNGHFLNLTAEAEVSKKDHMHLEHRERTYLEHCHTIVLESQERHSTLVEEYERDARILKALFETMRCEQRDRNEILDFAAEEFETIFTLYNDDVGSAQREEAVNTLWETSLQKRGEITRREERDRADIHTIFETHTADLKTLLSDQRRQRQHIECDQLDGYRQLELRHEEIFLRLDTEHLTLSLLEVLVTEGRALGLDIYEEELRDELVVEEMSARRRLEQQEARLRPVVAEELGLPNSCDIFVLECDAREIIETDAAEGIARVRGLVEAAKTRLRRKGHAI